ncbi:hypothetical protein EYF80_057456 [Liparis tanakae]|uniref:Uncharacterized protein n=1 Tax=Liparis tanakae TaxID=230148 RepID=A0A4Z2EU52_9TELE|nr:hypothetical protein EYF80_057456 [Liparis tanakae]
MKMCVSCKANIYVACKKCSKCKAQQPHKDRLLKARNKFAAEEKEWKEKVKRNGNGTHVLDSSLKMLDRLAALGYFPILLLGKKRRNSYSADVLTSIQMKLDDRLEENLKDIFSKIVNLHFKRPNSVTKEDSRKEQAPKETEYVVLDIVPVSVDGANVSEEISEDTEEPGEKGIPIGTNTLLL